MIALGVLTALVLAASLVVTRQVRSRAEAVAATGLVFNALIVGPIYVLGLANVLTRPILAITTVVLCGGIIAVHVRKQPRAALAALLRRFFSLATAPFSGIAAAARQRSLVTVAAVLALVAFPWLLLTAYLSPSWRDWDCLWYHEPIVAFTIQNHGFAKVDLPLGLQVVNGVQRLCEMTQLWFAIWAGRPLIDVANVVFMPLLGASMFSLARRYTNDIVASVGWACGLVLFPGFIRLVVSCMVDPQSGALLLAAAYFVTHHSLDRRRVAYAILALTLAVGGKIWSVVPVGLLTALLLVRLFANRRTLGWISTLLLAAATALATIGMQALTYVRNWVLFANPFWPMVQYENEKLGIHWKGTIAMSPSNRFSFNDPFFVFYEKMIGRPYTATGAHHQWQIDDFGFAWAWIVLPIGAACAALAVLRWFTGEVGARVGVVSTFESQTRARSAAALAIVAAASLYLSPAIHIARYHVAPVGMLAACICWLSTTRGRERKTARLAEATAVFASLGSIMMFYWAPRKTPYSFIFEPAQIVQWLKTPMPKREVVDAGSPPMLLSAVNDNTGQAREREIKRGDVVAFDDINFVALLWNNAYSNRVVWLSSPDPLAEAERINATWVYSRDGSALSGQLGKAHDSWEVVGPLEREHVGSVWRRRR